MLQPNITKIESLVCNTGRKFLESQGYIEIFPPRLVRASGACENIDTLFEVAVGNDKQWFTPNNKPTSAYLAQTGQLYLEALVPALNKVCCIGPSFRAEPSVDNRHLTEFTMLEIEFAGDFETLLQTIQATVHHMAQTVASVAQAKQVALSDDNIKRLSECPAVFARLTYDEAISSLQKLGEDIQWGDDISRQREQMLVKQADNIPLFITHFPDPMHDHGKEIGVEKFFNMLPDPNKPGRVQSADLILPFAGESVGSAARVHDADTLLARLTNSRMYKRLIAKGGSLDDFSWYINQLKSNGSVPHAGCGFGLARVIQWIHGSDSIHDCLTFPQNKNLLI
ncbi:MAG: amino acid--tRNA ligase-related protein [bacterium]